MGLAKHVYKCLFILSILCSISLIAVENSVIPVVEKWESIENLNSAKFSTNQYTEITSALNRLDEKIRIVSYNVLFNLYDHNLEEVNRWPQRLPRIVSLIDDMQPDIIGVQELYTSQYENLLPYVNETYAFYARECEDGELNGIFYRKDRFEVVDSNIWYMTATPDVPSSETLTMLKLKDLKTDKIVAVFNTHLAFSKVDKRDFQARFIAEKLEVIGTNTPVILTGDLNTFPHRMDLERLPFYDGDYVHRILTNGCLKDARDVAILGHVGPLSTFSNSPDADDTVPFKGTGNPGVFLDHIYVSKNINVLIHAIQPGTVDGHFPSDHLPILIDFTVGK